MDHDPSFDRLLRKSLRDDGSHGADACLDAEALAAWSDGLLAPADRAAIERHAAGCDRCVALLAAMVQSRPAAVPPARTGWFSLRWLVPLTAATAALTIWVAVNRDTLREAAPVAELAQHRPVPEVPVPSAPAASTPMPAEARRNDAPPESRPAPANPDDRSASASSVRPREAAAKGDREQPTPPSLTQAPAVNRPTPPPPAPPLASVAVGDPSPSSPAAETPPLSRDAVPLPPQPAPEQAAARGSAAVRGAAGRGGAIAGTQDIAAFRSSEAARIAPTLVATPNPQVRWQFAGRSISRSEDGGANWQGVPVTPPAILTAGACPGQNVCWFVGRFGTILRTEDGAAWRTIAAPAAVDLIAVTATDARSASIRTADGRTYRTTDGGLTWVVQEEPDRVPELPRAP